MLRSTDELNEYVIRATDGDIGHVKDFYFDDKKWVIRYFVVKTGSWLSNRKVLISPMAVNHANWEERMLPVSITKEQVKNSPDIDTDKPVSRQHEIHYLGYYGYPYYWGGLGLWGGGAYPFLMMPGYAGGNPIPSAAQAEAERANAQAEVARHEDDDPHLRSCNAIMDYHIQATDGDIGHVQGLLVDEETWAIRYLVVNTSNWWLGHEVLISPQWIENVSWPEVSVSIKLTRQQVKDAPLYDSTAQLNRKQEVGVYGHYGRAGYWVDEVKHTPTQRANAK